MNNNHMDNAARENYEKMLRNKGEYLTHLVNLDLCTSNEDYYKELEGCLASHREQIKKSKLNYESLVCCIIQYGYACYVSLWYQIRLETVTIILDTREFDLPNEPLNMYLGYRTVAYNQQLNLLDFIPQQYQRLLDAVQCFANTNDPGINLFKAQFDKLAKLQFVPPGKDFMLSLEETQLFRRHSMLLKVKNCSILNFIQSRNEQELLSKVKTSVKDNIEKLNDLIRSGQPTGDKVKEMQDVIEKSTLNFFQKLGVPMRVIEPTSPEDSYRLKMEIKFVEKEMNFEGNVSQIMNVLVPQNERSEVKFTDQEFLVEYSCQRSSICVKYITQVQLNVENSDLLMFQFNNLSFDSSNVSLELYEKVIPPNAKARHLAFKATSWFARKQPPIEKILLLMDVAMITAKIIEPEITKPLYASRDYTKPMELHKKVSHYISILNFVAKKIYYPKEQSGDTPS